MFAFVSHAFSIKSVLIQLDLYRFFLDPKSTTELYVPFMYTVYLSQPQSSNKNVNQGKLAKGSELIKLKMNLIIKEFYQFKTPKFQICYKGVFSGRFVLDRKSESIRIQNVDKKILEYRAFHKILPCLKLNFDLAGQSHCHYQVNFPTLGLSNKLGM